MTPELTLHRKLNEASRRIRLLLIYRWAARSICVGAGVGLFWLIASKLSWVEEPEPALLVGLLLLAAAAGVVAGLVAKLTPMDAARLTDQRTNSKERLSSAVEFERALSDDPILKRQVADAGAHAASIEVKRVYPVRISREAVVALVLTAALLGVFFLPKLPIFWSASKKAEMEAVRKQGLTIEKIAKDTEKAADKQKLDESKKASKEAQKLAQAMKQGKVDKKQSLIAMQKLTKRLAEQQKKLAMATTPAPKPMAKAAEEIKKALEQQQKAAEDAAKAREEAKKGQGKQGEKPDEKQKGEKKDAAHDPKAAQMKPPSQSMQKAQEALQKFAQALSDQSPEMQNQALQELADQLQKGEMSKQEMQQLQQQLKQVANALSKTDLDKVAQQMAEMAKLMEQMNLDPETLKKLAQLAMKAGGT